MARYEEQRNFLKSDLKTFSAIETDKQKGIPQPPNVKAYDADAGIVDLPAVDGGLLRRKTSTKSSRKEEASATMRRMRSR